MLVRSPRRLAFFTFLSFLFIIAILRQSPWASSNVYKQIPLFTSPNNISPSQDDNAQKPLDAGRGRLPWQFGRGRSLVDGQKDLNQTRVTDWKKYMEGMLKWPRPNWDGHWPPFEDYVDKQYDPNRWEQFPM
jgi:hypothetical protein